MLKLQFRRRMAGALPQGATPWSGDSAPRGKAESSCLAAFIRQGRQQMLEEMLAAARSAQVAGLVVRAHGLSPHTDSACIGNRPISHR